MSVHGSEDPMFIAEVRRVVRFAAEQEAQRIDAIEVAVVSADHMADVHGRYCGDPTPTDVLTFDLSAGTKLAGQIVVCRDVAAEQAKERGHTTEEELLLYILHGVLHLCGYDDLDEPSYDAMHAREDELLAELGLRVRFM